jgi:hypothetical protein
VRRADWKLTCLLSLLGGKPEEIRLMQLNGHSAASVFARLERRNQRCLSSAKARFLAGRGRSWREGLREEARTLKLDREGPFSPRLWLGST